MAERKTRKRAEPKPLKWRRYRFTTSEGDYRPIVFNPAFPWWCSGFNADGDAVIVAYLPKHEPLSRYWDDAAGVTFTDEEDVTFSERFPRPDYYRPLGDAKRARIEEAGR